MSPRALRKVVEQRLLTGSGDYQDYGSISNPGLILSRYLIDQRAGEQERDSNRLPKTGTKFLLEKVGQATVPDGYKLAYERWISTLTSRKDIQLDMFGQNGRLAVGIGEASVLETSLALRQPWGMPYIPGSALKGLAASYLRNVASGGDPAMKPPLPEVDEHGENLVKLNAYSVLFGTDQSAAYITWHDAWFVPDSRSKPFREDVLTTHHPGYYQNSETNAEPTDFDDPTPIPFLSVSGSFLIALQGPPDWTNFALEVLKQALEHSGIGAKTNAGYGRLKHVREVYRYEEPPDLIQELFDSIETTSQNQINLSAHGWVRVWHRLPEEAKQKAAEAIIAKVRQHSKTYRRKFEEEGSYGADLLKYLSDRAGEDE